MFAGASTSHLLAALLALTISIASASINTTNTNQCVCGYQDPTTNAVYTDAIIVYFNETTAIDHHLFSLSDFEHTKEKSWSSIYKQGAKPLNAVIGNGGALPWQYAFDGNQTNLELWVDSSQPNHLVNGAWMRSVRQDILYGTFRSSMRSPQQWIGGSSLGMRLDYNDSMSLEIDMLNMNDPKNAMIASVVNGEWPTYDIGVNYTVLEKGNATLPPLRPWDFIDLRFDWAEDNVNFWVGKNNTRSVTKKDRTLPTVPQPLSFRHWSTGNTLTMEGPPINRSVGNVQYVRAFFNSSLMTAEKHAEFDDRCQAVKACSVNDISLRGSTSFTEAATIPYKEPTIDSHIRTAAGIVAGVFSTFGIIALLNALIRRTPWHKLKALGVVHRSEPAPEGKTLYEGPVKKAAISIPQIVKDGVNMSIPRRRKSSAVVSQSQEALTGVSDKDQAVSTATSRPYCPPPSAPLSRAPSYPKLTPAPSYRTLREGATPSMSGTDTPMTPLPSYPSHLRLNETVNLPNEEDFNHNLKTAGDARSISPLDTASESDEKIKRISPVDHLARNSYIDHIPRNPFEDDDDSRPQTPNLFTKHKATNAEQGGHFEGALQEKADNKQISFRDQKGAPKDIGPISPATTPGIQEALTTGVVPISQPKTAAPQTKRIDHLAGFVALSCIGVTFRHFSLTFWPYVTEGAGFTKHFQADTWIAYILGPYILTPLWIGPFFVTSCRFLSARYLKNGKLSDIAQKVLLRGPRMLIPCFIFMTLEYFLISLGTTASLEWLPSISYSTWPYVTPQPNFGVFLNEMVELSYLIPNAAPEVINHYCVGVLWTIPVQHFFSYVTLLAAVMVRDIKAPWKRMTFYFFAIFFGWYASSWSACHWMGLMLTDLDLTYDWIKWTQARPRYLYPLLTLCFAVGLVSPLTLLFNSEIFYYSFMSYENAIHPDAITGQPILFTKTGLVYPDYFTPSLALLLFSTSLQIIVEMSTWVQWIFSLKVLTKLHPYIMTIYLIHGFVFWSIGAWLAVKLSSNGLPYEAVLLVVALVCYILIILGAWLISPLIEFTTQSAMKNIWRWAVDEPVPHRLTVAPFSKALVLDRGAEAKEGKMDA
ncbi:Hypothetical protein R9X50_00480200 [Acrodontium crateriforme]|uniref:GH16 domain-containing protein n=1 Tax=Acrodontium crateriforme TaxID=150365 RepID=A0AAQ3RCY6_9PEZI|nr:Hypothetical protein R9X50_00480200 [Acrodontium crateriforme]